MTTFRSVGLLNVLQGVRLRWPPVACLVMAAPSSLRDKNLCILRAILAGWMLAAIVAASPLMGQSPNYGVGRSPTPEEIKSWDISIGPDGKELPPGEGRAIEGKEVYTRRCADCHGSKGQGGAQGEALVGGEGTLDSTQPVKTVGSYWPYATTLWDYINRAMPFDSPGSLTHKQVYALVAYLLYLNGIIEEEEVLNAQTLPQVRMPNREGFVPDPRPDVGTKDQSQMH